MIIAISHILIITQFPHPVWETLAYGLSSGKGLFMWTAVCHLLCRSEEEAKRQCAEAEQKLRQEWQRSVSLEQQLEKARLDLRKEASVQTSNRSRTGSVWPHVDWVWIRFGIDGIGVSLKPMLHCKIQGSLNIWWSQTEIIGFSWPDVGSSGSTLSLPEKQEGSSPRSPADVTRDAQLSELRARYAFSS